MRAAGILFDFDHTLVDSPIDFVAMRQGVYDVIDRYGVAVPDRDRHLILEVLEQAVAMVPGETSRAMREEAERGVLEVELTAARQACEVAGAASSLARLRAEGRGVAIITRNCRQVVEGVLAQLPLPYDVLLTRDDVSDLKPHPGHAWAACTALGVAPAEALLVGDFRADIECALAAGMVPIGVTTGSADAAALYAAGALAVLPSVAALPDWLRQQGW
ncbi:MAG: HAD family hydrolase [Armatimonadetes bacterium]|nr:HAD family hydrolase [Armatimonadota bacterium]